MKNYEYAIEAEMYHEDGSLRVVKIPLGLDEPKTGLALANEYAAANAVGHGETVKSYRVIRREVGEWEIYNGEDN